MTDNRLTDSQALLDQLRKGDANAFTQLYKTYWYPLFLVAYRKLNDKASAEEVVQEIFTRLWKNRATNAIDDIEFYLFSAVRYEVINAIRSRMVRHQYTIYVNGQMRQEASNTDEIVAFNELASLIEQGLQTLPTKSGEIFRLSRFDALTIPQIAQRLRTSDKVVEYHLTKALKHLRGYIAMHSIVHSRNSN